MPLIESGGSALDMGAVNDGEFLKRSGANIIGDDPASGAIDAVARSKASDASSAASNALSKAMYASSAIAGLGGGHSAATVGTTADDIFSLDSQVLEIVDVIANNVLVGPISGTASSPTFRALELDDLPSGLWDAVPSLTARSSTGDPDSSASWEGLFCINTFDHTLRVYAEGAWRSVADWS